MVYRYYVAQNMSSFEKARASTTILLIPNVIIENNYGIRKITAKKKVI